MAETQSPAEDAKTRSAVRPPWASLALLLLALIAAAPLWMGPGLVNTRSGGDSPFLFIRLHQLVENLRAGVFPARWMPDAAYGLGYPFFNFYAALPYYFAAIFNLIGFDLLASIKIVQSLGFVLAAWAMFGWAGRWSRPVMGSTPASTSAATSASVSASGDASYSSGRVAWLAAVAYTFAPFHLVNVYVRGDSLSEFYTFVFYPLVLWAIDRLIDRPRKPQPVALLALAYGGLILTHNVSALIFSPFALLYVVLSLFSAVPAAVARSVWRPRTTMQLPSYLSFIPHPSAFILQCALGLLLGLLLSAWFWLPALGEAPLVQLDAQTTGYFNYAGHFRSADLVQSSIGFDYDTEPPRTPFAMGLAQAAATLAGVVAVFAAGRHGLTWRRIFLLAGLILSTVMITPLSKPAWDALPLLPLAQFPWRFLSVQALFTSLAIGYLAHSNGDRPATYCVLRTIVPEACPERSRRAKRSGIPSTLTQYAREARNTTLWAAIVGLALAASTFLPLRPDYLPIRADEITPERIQLYEAFTTNIGTTIRAEYLPRTTIPRPYTGPALIDAPRAIPVRGEAQAAQTLRGPVAQAWTVRAASDSTLAFPTLYFPGWRASIDGRPVEARAAADLGYVEVDVPMGEHTVALSFERTPLRAGAEIVSLAAALGLVGIWVMDRRRPVLRVAYCVFTRRYEVALLALGCLFAVIATSSNAVEARDDDLTMDFESTPWLRHQLPPPYPGDTLQLRRYEYSDSFTPGKPFNVALEWSGRSSLGWTATAQLVAPSLHAFGGPEPLASAGAPIRLGVNHYTLNIPETLSKGAYYVKVEARHASGRSQAMVLKPISYSRSPTAPDPSTSLRAGARGWARVGQAIELRAVHLKHLAPERLTVTFDWVALQPIAANYAVSLRLQDAGGRVWVALDTQPGYGFQPTSAWLPGETQRDIYTLGLPADLPRDASYSLDGVWYRVASLQEIGRVRVPGISIGSLYDTIEAPPPQRNFTPPPMQQRVDATFGGVIRLLGYELMRSEGTIALTLHWQALADVGADYQFFVHVFDPATERIAAQIDAMPGGNAHPTSRWLRGEVVSESLELELGFEAGVYRIATGWTDPVSKKRLAALDEQGTPLPADRVALGEAMRVP